MTHESKDESFQGLNPEMGVGGDAVAEFERRNAIERLEGVIEALNRQMPLQEVAATLRGVANQLDYEHIVSLAATTGEEDGEEACGCEGDYVCPIHSGVDGPAYE